MLNGGTLASGVVGTISGLPSRAPAHNIAPAASTQSARLISARRSRSTATRRCTSTWPARTTICWPSPAPSRRRRQHADDHVRFRQRVGRRPNVHAGHVRHEFAHDLQLQLHERAHRLQSTGETDRPAAEGDRRCASGNWNNNSGGNYSVSANWDSSAVPNGVGLIATFADGNPAGAVNAANVTVNVDTANTVGSLVFDPRPPPIPLATAAAAS